ncbi:MAG: metallophosphoesterase [Chitinophagaceae bacterium]|jgi:predicted phosphodiesterase|nr:metallophosphoesterase [Chitinophagaceae bacterium]
MRRFLRSILLKPVLWASAKFSSRPEKQKIFESLSKLIDRITAKEEDKGPVITFDINGGRFIIFSDHHKGARDGADDFAMAEPNYLAALDYYFATGYTLINLGDSEELWENSLGKVKKFNQQNLEAEKKFLQQKRFIKIFGNHDLYWDNDPLAWWQLKAIYGEKLKVYEAALLSTTINGQPLNVFCTHGHQGDAQSDGNWFSKFFVAKIWAPFQAYLRINPNTPAYDGEKKSLHNSIMYEWSSLQKNMLLITGHTHQPVFGSLTLLERLYRQFQQEGAAGNTGKQAEIKIEIRKREKEFAAVAIDYMTMKPSYFNSGCCCYSDGDITGIEIADGCIRLIKWTLPGQVSHREVLEEIPLTVLASQL